MFEQKPLTVKLKKCGWQPVHWCRQSLGGGLVCSSQSWLFEAARGDETKPSVKSNFTQSSNMFRTRKESGRAASSACPSTSARLPDLHGDTSRYPFPAYTGTWPIRPKKGEKVKLRIVARTSCFLRLAAVVVLVKQLSGTVWRSINPIVGQGLSWWASSQQ